jgi:hypothetical protein
MLLMVLDWAEVDFGILCRRHTPRAGLWHVHPCHSTAGRITLSLQPFAHFLNAFTVCTGRFTLTARAVTTCACRASAAAASIFTLWPQLLFQGLKRNCC